MEPMLKLRNVSKFYYHNGQVSSGFTKVSLDLTMGEFVVIVGESGSGKSTLLNVLSGLDSYQEGEMYINGEETSHYGDLDFEEYRKKYIGNIFQNFNLINSYTVYQNIELMMLINGHKKKEIKPRVMAIIKQVGLEKYARQKVSKLSGGQKQRVAIARVLAKDTPIIVADEPTGNLDVESAHKIFEILHEISKDKLVIVVTHNYEQVEAYATRKIRMHDGQIIEDETLKPTSCETPYEPKEHKTMRLLSKLRLGLRNTFNVPIKFVLIMLVYLLICCAVMSGYTTMAKDEDISSHIGYSYYFRDTAPERIIIQKEDRTAITDEDFQTLHAMDNINKIVKDDVTVDGYVSMGSVDGNYYFYGRASSLETLQKPLDMGRMPENEYEVVLMASRNDYYLSEQPEMVLDQEFILNNNYTGENMLDKPIKVVGVVLYDYEAVNYYSSQDAIYLSDELMDVVRLSYYKQYSTIVSKFRSSEYKSEPWMYQYQVIPSKKVPKGKVYISEDMMYECPKMKCAGLKFKVTASNLYYQDTLNLKVKGTYNKKNIKSKTGFKDYAMYNGAFFVNDQDYRSLFENGIYQSSVYVDDVKKIDDTIASLKEMGYHTLRVEDGLIGGNDAYNKISRIFMLVVYAIMGVVLFFIAYFIIQLIYRSRNVYYSTIRILGANKKVAKALLSIELFSVANLAYLTVVGIIYAVREGIIEFALMNDMVTYLQTSDYVVLYVMIVAITFLITHKYAKKLFMKSAMDTYRQEV